MKEGKTKIFKLEECSENFLDPLGNNSFKSDVFVIANPPKDSIMLLNLVRRYNEETFNKRDWEEYNSYYRYFFEETPEMDRNYKPSNKGYFDKEDVGNHYDKCIIKVEWNIDEKDVEYPIYSFYEDGFIKQIYYPKGRKNFGNKSNEWIKISI